MWSFEAALLNYVMKNSPKMSAQSSWKLISWNDSTLFQSLHIKPNNSSTQFLVEILFKNIALYKIFYFYILEYFIERVKICYLYSSCFW